MSRISTKRLYDIRNRAEELIKERVEYDAAGEHCLHQDVSRDDLRQLIRFIQKVVNE